MSFGLHVGVAEAGHQRLIHNQAAGTIVNYFHYQT